jgi:hypothetical protein
MKRTAAALSLALFLAIPSIEAKKPRRSSDVEVSVVFSSGDVHAIHDYYRADPRPLPPGLQKKLARGGTLPPGWRKKLAPFPPDLDRRLGPVRCEDCRRGIVEGHAVIYNHRTMAIIDVVAILGH